MDSSKTSQRLTALAQQLSLYKPPPSLTPDDDDDEKSKEIEDRSNKVVSQVGFAESSTPIVQTLKQVERNNGSSFKPKKAAVLVCLFEGDNGELRVILTKRSSRLSTHSGEVALPGGKMDEGDKDEAETAKREAHEEIGLDPALVNVVTFLEPFLSKIRLLYVMLAGAVYLSAERQLLTTCVFAMLMAVAAQICPVLPTDFFAPQVKSFLSIYYHVLRVIPVIGILSNKEAFKPVPNVGEVDSIFDAPLEMFIKDENRRVEEREWMGCKYLIHFFDYETDNKKYLIWGLTAAILIRAASVVYGRSPPFLAQNPAMSLLRNLNKDDILP